MYQYKKEQIFNSKSNVLSDIRDLWGYRELLYFFSLRDIKVKYKQTVLGVLWVVLQPLLLLSIYSIVFQKLWVNEQLKVPYPLFLLPGLLYWSFFSATITSASNSLVSNSSMIKKIYFPRVLIPISCISISFVDLFISFILITPLLVYYSVEINWIVFLIFFPISILSVILSTIGFSLFFSSLNLKYRDFRFIIPFFMQILMFLSPVIYSKDMVNNEFINLILYFNPIAAPIELIRYAIVGIHPDWKMITISQLSSFVFAIIGFFTFKRSEHLFADLA